MIKTTICTVFFTLGFVLAGFSQNVNVDSLRRELAISKNDTSRILIMSELSFAYGFRVNGDSALGYADRAIELARQNNFTRGEVRALFSKSGILETKGDLPEALKLAFDALNISRKHNFLLETSMCLTQIANVFYDLNDFPRAISFYREATVINKEIEGQEGAEYWKYQTEVNLGTAFMLSDQLDSSFVHLQKAYSETLNDENWHPVFSMFFGRLQFLMGRHDAGINYLHQSIEIFEHNKDHYSTSDACRIIASCFEDLNEIDSSIYYGRRALQEARSIDYKTSILLASKLLAEAYESKDIKQAIYFRKVFDSTNDILYGANKVKSLQKTLSDEEDRQRRIEAERVAYQNRLKEYSLIAGLAIILLIAFILFRNNLQKKKANVLLQHQKEKVESTLQELKSTQAQLIQSEKMASLGELTAGIAHEIQNPLNFVNNFSELNNELINELVVEVDKGNTQEAKTIANDLRQNLEKINHHGKRADAIVKGMLQHSRSSSGQKELTDINALCDEYLRLAYHGMRARDKFFTAQYATDFDNSIDKVTIVPQDIGRVMLNLINNAFYAVDEKAKQNTAEYEPIVIVGTKRLDGKVEVLVRDNGNGIPETARDKIFQPFFTTKPTGQGTGLGLSLSYDIVRAHGGEIRVETREGQGSEFFIQLPAG